MEKKKSKSNKSTIEENTENEKEDSNYQKC